MNKIINQTEEEFKNSIFKMSEEEKTSLLRLIIREISLTQQELKRTHELLELSKEKRNNLEIFRYEQNIRDIDLEVEKLDRKRYICESQNPNQNLNGNVTKKPNTTSKVLTNGSALSLPIPSSKSPVQHDNENVKIELSTKKLINSFEKMSDSVPSNTAISNKNKVAVNFKEQHRVDNSASLPRNSKLKIQTQSSQSTEQPLFAQIKLKKVGLPPDAQESDQSLLPDATPTKRLSVNQIVQSPVNNSSRSASVDFTRYNPNSAKDKFHNPNKDIQVAIQNEIKDVRLKKIDLQSPPLNVAVEQVNMGKFNFSNERSISSSSYNSLPTPMSASKSMPFLNSIASMSISKDESTDPPISQMASIGEHDDAIDGELSNVDSFLRNWDPTVVLKKLYTIQRKSKQSPTNGTSRSKYCSYIDVIHGPNNGRIYQRKYISISNGQLNFYTNQASKSATDTLDIRHIDVKLAHNDSIEIYDSRGIHSTLRCLRPSDCQELIALLGSKNPNESCEIVPHLYEDVTENHPRKVLIVDLGSCSVRAGLLKTQPTLPGLYFPHIAAISKTSKNVVSVGVEAFDPKLLPTCDIIRPLKPDTTLEDVAFTSGTVESMLNKICSTFKVNPPEYIVMLSLPYNVAESTRSKLADVLLLRLNFKGISMCGESLLAIHAYGEPTGVLVDIGFRTEILPVTHGVVQTAAVRRGLFGGHLMQVALSHLLPFELRSIVDFVLVRLIMEEACCVAPSSEEAHRFSKLLNINLRQYNLPSFIQSSLVLQGKDRCLPTEGLFNPEIYSIDTSGLSKIIVQAVQSCPMDLRKDLYQSICLSGATTQITGLIERLEYELKEEIPNNCKIKVSAAADRAHFSYVGACFVASSEGFMDTIVSRREWEDNRVVALRRWHF